MTTLQNTKPPQMRRKHCRTPSSKPSVSLMIGRALGFSTISVISDLCLLLRLFCQYTSCLPEVRGHAVYHGEDPSSWNLPRPWFAQFRVRLTVKFLLYKWNIVFCALCFLLPSSVCLCPLSDLKGAEWSRWCCWSPSFRWIQSHSFCGSSPVWC